MRRYFKVTGHDRIWTSTAAWSENGNLASGPRQNNESVGDPVRVRRIRGSKGRGDVGYNTIAEFRRDGIFVAKWIECARCSPGMARVKRGPTQRSTSPSRSGNPT